MEEIKINNNGLNNKLDNNLNNTEIEKQIFDIFNDLKNKPFCYNYLSTNSEETKYLATIFANNLNIGDIIILNGELGAGKTVFMSGIAEYFNIEDQVSSPTFSIVNNYLTPTDIPISHFDLYRITSVDEFLEDIGQDHFQNSICVIEWGNIIQEILPKNTIYIDISKDESDFNLRHLKIWRK